MRILLVDPDATSRRVIASWLDEFFGHVSIDQASSATEALQAIHTDCPDLVMAAYPLATPGGVELSALIKARPNPPVIVLLTLRCATGLDLQIRDLLLEKRHLQSRLLAFLQRRFPKVWAEGVTARSLASCR